MARKKSQDLTEAELRLMDVIWRKGSATVAEVAEALPKQLGLAYNTVLTTMRILEDKGYVRHTKSKEGRAFLYHPVVGQKEASRNAVRRLLTRFFRDSPEELVLNLLEDEELSEQELTRIRKRISEEVIREAEGKMNILGTTFAALLNSLWQSAAIALLVWAALRFLPRMNIRINAATRCAVWWAVLAAVVLLPLAPQPRASLRAPLRCFYRSDVRFRCRRLLRQWPARPSRLHATSLSPLACRTSSDHGRSRTARDLRDLVRAFSLPDRPDRPQLPLPSRHQAAQPRRLAGTDGEFQLLAAGLRHRPHGAAAGFERNRFAHGRRIPPPRRDRSGNAAERVHARRAGSRDLCTSWPISPATTTGPICSHA